MKKLLLLCILSIVFYTASSQEKVWFNDNLNVEYRIEALLEAMTLDEKITQTVNESKRIDRLNIDAYNWWSEALHGVARSGRATIFPQAIGLGATFDPDLLLKIGDAVSDEARAIHNYIINNGKESGLYQGLSFWSPNVNIFRDPRWGRGQETYGEDPFLTGKLGASFIKGLQGDDERYLKVAACAKHFAVHSGPEALRHEFNAQVSQKDLRETYLPAFKQCVDAGVEAVMCAYNRTNEEACCGSNALINTILLDEWNFKGHVVSDCGALLNFHNNHKVTSNAVESAALALRSGVNINCGNIYGDHLKEAIMRGLVTEKALDESLRRVLRTRFKLGLFDSAAKNKYRSLGPDVINDQNKKNLALEAARKSMVLLKNDHTLPLKKNSDFIYMCGPLANNNLSLVGNYNGINSDMRTIVEGIASHVSPSTRLQYRQGALLTTENKNALDWYSGLASDADATVVVLGLTLLLEGEEGESIASADMGDILDMRLPESQIELLRKISQNAHKSKKKVISVICAGMPLDMREVVSLSDAVLYAWYPGEQGGNAVADILFGDVSPSGKLPITFPESVTQLPAFDDYSMTGRTYKYMKNQPLFPFGFGLCYGELTWGRPQLNAKKLSKNKSLTIEVPIHNRSVFEQDEVVQIYMGFDEKYLELPISSLIDFKRVSLSQDEKRILRFSIPYEKFSYYDQNGKFCQHHGDAILYVGNSSPGKRSEELKTKIFQFDIKID